MVNHPFIANLETATMVVIADILAITIIVDDDTVIEFQRKATFRFANGANNSKRIIAGHDHLEVSTTKIGQFSNTDVKTGPDADIIVNPARIDHLTENSEIGP